MILSVPLLDRVVNWTTGPSSVQQCKQFNFFAFPEEPSAAWLPARTTTSKNLTQSREKTGRAVLLASSLNEEVCYHRPVLGIGGALVKLQADLWFAFGWRGQI